MPRLRGQAVRQANGLGYRVQEATRILVADLLRDGYGRNVTARLTNLGLATVTRIGREAGLDPGAIDSARRTRTEKQLAAASVYSLTRRLEVYNLLADRLVELASAEDLTPSQHRDLSVSGGILTDKYRLDTGEATQRTENTSVVVYLPQKRPVPVIDVTLRTHLLTDGHDTPGAAFLLSDAAGDDAPDALAGVVRLTTGAGSPTRLDDTASHVGPTGDDDSDAD